MENEDSYLNTKRNCLLVFSFIGSDYHGSAINEDFKTVEGDIMDTIYKTEFILETNKFDFKKNSLKRTSRVDKGVHAAEFILTLKLEYKKKAEEMKAEINSLLPSNIRLQAIFVVGKKFCPRKNIDYRNYRYIFPTEDLEFDLERANKLFLEMKGVKKFHNFTSKVESKDDCSRRKIIDIKVEKINEKFAIVKISGQSFMKNQIRKMVASVFYALKNGKDEKFINKLFEAEKICIPVGLPNGLYLRNSVFYNKDKRLYKESLELDKILEDIKKYEKEVLWKKIMDKKYIEEFKDWIEFVSQEKDRYKGFIE